MLHPLEQVRDQQNPLADTPLCRDAQFTGQPPKGFSVISGARKLPTQRGRMRGSGRAAAHSSATPRRTFVNETGTGPRAAGSGLRQQGGCAGAPRKPRSAGSTPSGGFRSPVPTPPGSGGAEPAAELNGLRRAQAVGSVRFLTANPFFDTPDARDRFLTGLALI
jgi:hypothetical protein